MTRRTRSVRYGACVAVVIAGVVCGVAINGTAGGTAATVLVGIGLVGVISLLFYEVGLTEDRAMERGIRSPYLPDEPAEDDGGPEPMAGEDAGRRESDGRDGHPEHAGGHGMIRPRALDRRRGRRRRLR